MRDLSYNVILHQGDVKKQDEYGFYDTCQEIVIL